jgi:hypothetical protein
MAMWRTFGELMRQLFLRLALLKNVADRYRAFGRNKGAAHGALGLNPQALRRVVSETLLAEEGRESSLMASSIESGGLVRLLNRLIKKGLRLYCARAQEAWTGETAGFLVIGPPSNRANTPPPGMRPS